MTGPILAIDQGTTNTKAVLVDGEGRFLSQASRPVPLAYPRAGWVEQDAVAVWKSVQGAVDECLAGASGVVPSGVAISNQRESVVVWERATGRPAGPVVIWQCRRTSERCDQLRLDGVELSIRERTGLPIDPLFSATKLAWLLDEIPHGRDRAADGALCAGTVDSWLLWNLTGGAVHRCDTSNASRTQLLNLRTLAWDETLLELFGVPAAVLPEIHPSSGVFGETVVSGSIRAGLPIASMIGDSHAALFGQGGFRAGSVKATYGTGSSLMTTTPELISSKQGLCSTVAWSIGPTATYALEGNISATGAALQWVADLLGLEDPAKAADLAASVQGTEGVSLVPAFVGLGAPYWAERARGLLTGITRGTTGAHLARAALEAIAFQVRDVFAAMMCDGRVDAAVLLADGGATRSDHLMQLQADVLGTPVVRNNATDISALGAAYLAGLALGTWRSLDEIDALPKSLKRFEPRIDDAARQAALVEWQGAVARCLFEPAVAHASR
ncbi:MAG TPA: glycerol kinase GlpK [Gemmatimonadaceae bacterium]